MEKVGENSSDGAINKKKWAILFSVFGVVIVGLVVAIVVVKNLRKVEPEEYEVVAEGEYYAVSSEIWNEIIENSSEMDEEKMLALYERNIEAATDEDVKSMLTMDYYESVTMYDLDGDRKDEVMEAMLAADEKLKTPLSASKIISMAISYNNQELEEKYRSILEERISMMDDSTEGI